MQAGWLVKQAEKQGFTVNAWTLCIPVDLDAATLKWWSTWKKDKERETKMRIDGRRIAWSVHDDAFSSRHRSLTAKRTAEGRRARCRASGWISSPIIVGRCGPTA